MHIEQGFIVAIIISFFIVALIATIITIILVTHQKRFVFDKEVLKIKSEFQESMLTTQLEIQEQTFGHISREIHDHVGQRLTLAKFHLSSISIKKEEALVLSDTASQLIGEAIADLKQLSRSLTSSVIEDNGLLYALEQEIQRIARLVPWKIELRITGDSKFISTDNELIIFRIVQEALQNIIKYAEPQQVFIDFHFTPGQIALEVIDDGKGFYNGRMTQPSSSGKSGLANMKKRTSLLNGTMEIFSSPGNGTKLSFIFPLNHTYA
jgi:signal transduction histidine kinase